MKGWNLKMEKEKNKRNEIISNALVGFFFAAIFLSLIIFVPQTRNKMIVTAETILGRSIDRQKWFFKLILLEIDFLTAAIGLFLLFRAKNSGYAKDDGDWKIVSWIFTGIYSLFLIALASCSDDVWLDETFSLGLARHNIKDIINLTAQDVHPPLYYCILKSAATLAPNSIHAAKIVSAIPTIIIMCVSNIFFAREFSNKQSALFNCLLMSTAAVLEYSVEIRMYSWCMLFCALCCGCSYYILKKGGLKYFLLYILFAECGAYCHYWTAFGLATNFVLICAARIIQGHDKRAVKKMLASATLGIVLYLPWAGVVIEQFSRVKTGFGIERPIDIFDFIGFIETLAPMFYFTKFLTFISIGVFIIKFISASLRKNVRSARKTLALICIATPLSLITLATIISAAVRPLFLDRYAVPFIPFAVFFLTISINESKINAKKYLIITSMAIAGSVLSSAFIYRTERKLARNWNEFQHLMDSRITTKTAFAFPNNIDAHIPLCIAYLYPRNKIYGINIGGTWGRTISYEGQNNAKAFDEEKDICFFGFKDALPPEQFLSTESHTVNMGSYKNVRLYFSKKE